MRVDEANAFLWRALITGPDDTPYNGGCFIFDIYFPPTYPQVCRCVVLAWLPPGFCGALGRRSYCRCSYSHWTWNISSSYARCT